MKQKNLWLLVGIPGSGKSTWVKEQMKTNPGAWCSRDNVRFSMVGEDEDYFARENEVFEAWIFSIQAAIRNNSIENVYIDATHLNEKSRNKVLNRLNLEGVALNAVVFNTPLEICLERNAQRTGRACVPETAIRNMYKNFRNPAYDKRKYDKIIEIGGSF